MLYLLLLPLLPLVRSDDFTTVLSRRRADIAVLPITASYARNAKYSDIPWWMSTLRSDGSWPDVNYAAGCDGDRTTWLAEEHWARVLGLAQAWSGLNPAIPSNYTASPDVWSAATAALDWWFANDYNNTACLQNGGKTACPCSTPGLWNQNWYFQGIGLPTLASESCLLLSSGNLTDHQRTKCLDFGTRGSAYGSQPLLPAYQTASNLALILQSCISAALYSQNVTLLQSAFSQAMSAFSLKSFIQLQNEAVGTTFAANEDVQDTIATFLKGDNWQIFTNQGEGKLYWDFSVIGRWISHPRADGYATSGIGLNVTALSSAVQDFSSANNVSDVLSHLQQTGVQPLGNKAYWAGDYMVHRRNSYVLFNKLISSRGQNQEFTNGDNTMGYHLSQGHLFTWTDGSEYQDLAGAWDWYLLPGTTVLYHYPTLDTSWVGVKGKRDFVGVVSDGENGFSVMDFVDPHDGSISYRRAWFYIEDIVLNTIVNATRLAGSAPIVTVLDQRLSSGPLFVDGSQVSPGNVSAKTVRYGPNGYLAYDQDFALATFDGPRTGDWSMFGTSSATTTTQNVFLAYHTIPSGGSFTYAQLPNTSAAQLASEASNPSVRPLSGTGVSGAVGLGYIALAFWPGSASVATIASNEWTSGTITFSVNEPCIVLASKRGGQVEVRIADPTQKLAQVSLTIQGEGFSCGPASGCEQSGGGLTLAVTLPTGGFAGDSVFQTVLLA